MSEIKNIFRATNGLDAAGEKIINVATADKNTLTDGVNVDFFIQENTIQEYSEKRSYVKGFVVTNGNRIWVAKEDTAPGPFNELYWHTLRTDPKWKTIPTPAYQLNAGDYIAIDTNVGTSYTLTLPSNAQDGDTVSIVDVGGRPGLMDVVFKADVQSIMDRGEKLKETKMTIPYSEFLFVYINKLWNLYTISEANLGRFIKSGSTVNVQSGETIIRQYDTNEPISLKFPKNAINGDIITIAGLDINSTTPYYTLQLSTFDNTTSIVTQGQTSKTYYRSIAGYFVFHAQSSTWKFFDSDITNRLRVVTADTDISSNETVSVMGNDNVTTQTINLKLPTQVENGDRVTVSLKYIRKGQTVNILTSGTDVIMTNQDETQFPKRSSYPPDGAWSTTNKLTYNGATSYPPVIVLAYYRGTINQWVVVENLPSLERVDSSTDETRKRLGVIALSDQATANLDKENMTTSGKELAITPETLANRTATETRRGIARISTQGENNLVSDSTAYLDDVIVTPKKLDQKKATETMRGLAEIATQDEVNASTDDTRIITPKKLDTRRASPTLAGIAPVVVSGGVAGTSRTMAGTLIYNFNDYSNIVTPKTLSEFKSTENQLGAVILATSAEVIGGVSNSFPLVVTPAALQTKTATESRIGFAEIATQDETNAGLDDVRFVTPKKLAGLASSETLAGVSKIATQSEFDNGVLDNAIATPLKIKTFFNNTNRTSVIASSGLVESGTLWMKHTLDIKPSSETQRGTLALSTQELVNAGIDDTTAITPKKLQAKKATTLLEGIIRLSTSDEVVDGTSVNTSVSPSTLKNAIQVDINWESNTTRRGTVKMTEGALTFVGNNTQGSTQDLEKYLKTGYAISPYELNKTLSNFMPLKAKAVDSDKLDGLDGTQFIRRDIDQTVDGSITFNNNKTTIIGDTDQNGVLTLGKSGDGTTDTDKTRLILNTPYNGKVWTNDISGNDSTSTYKFNYGSATNLITQINISSDGSLTSRGNITSGADINATGKIKSTGQISTNASYLIGEQSVISSGTGVVLNLSNSTRSTNIKTIDASNLTVQDASNNFYVVLTSKNMNEQLDGRYVNSTGDTMSGRLNVNSPIVANIQQTIAPISENSLNSNNFGTWVTDVTTSSLYQNLPGYVVGVPEINPETGEPTGFIDHYDEFKGPGTLSQFGSSSTDGSGTYQIWAPRPSQSNVSKDGHSAKTFYMRSWNTSAGKFDDFGRVYTTNNPPTAGEIGALTDTGAIISSLKIKDWIQIGNLKIYADPATKTVKFDWVE